MSSPLKILIRYPSRNRISLFRDTLEKYIDTGTNKCTFQFSIDEDERYKYTPIIYDICTFKKIEFIIGYGECAGKVSAINRSSQTDSPIWKEWDIILLASDDMVPVKKGWDEVIRNDMEKSYPDLDGVLYYPDGYQKLNTMPIMGRKYYERFGYIYDPAFMSLWVDNLFELQTDKLGKQMRFNNILFRHENPLNGKEYNHTDNELMKKNNSYFFSDKKVFYRRKQELGL